MNPWRLDTDYDRPIPRRLAEQAGLPREMFGQVKMASVLEYPSPASPIGHQLHREYLNFLIVHGVLSHAKTHLLPLVRRWNAMVWTTSPRRHAWNYYLQRVISKLLGRRFTFPQVLTRLNGSLFCFCVNRTADTYCRDLKVQSEDPVCPASKA